MFPKGTNRDEGRESPKDQSTEVPGACLIDFGREKGVSILASPCGALGRTEDKVRSRSIRDTEWVVLSVMPACSVLGYRDAGLFNRLAVEQEQISLTWTH